MTKRDADPQIVQPTPVARNKGGAPRKPRTVPALMAQMCRAMLDEAKVKPRRRSRAVHPDAPSSQASTPAQASAPIEGASPPDSERTP